MTMWQSFRCGLMAMAATVLLSSAAVAAEPELRASPNGGNSSVGGQIIVTIGITDISDLFAYQFSLSFDPSKLLLNNVSAGSFLSGAGSTVFDGGVIDNGNGQLSFLYESLIGAVPGASGSGLLATLQFDVVGAGTSGLFFSDVLFLDSSLSEISLQVTPGFVTTVPEPAAALLFALGLAGLLGARRRAV
ncbi:MAG: cohesin domain-containing protein [Inhella sp.]|jgi:hypothetical protein